MATWPNGKAATIWRDFVDELNPGSGKWRVRKSHVRTYLTIIEDIILASGWGDDQNDIPHLTSFHPTEQLDAGLWMWDSVTANAPHNESGSYLAMYIPRVGAEPRGTWFAFSPFDTNEPKIYCKATSAVNNNWGAWREIAFLGSNSIGSYIANLGSTDIGYVAMCRNVSGATINTAVDTNGTNLRFSDANPAGGIGSTPSGTWKCRSQTKNNEAGIFVKRLD